MLESLKLIDEKDQDAGFRTSNRMVEFLVSCLLVGQALCGDKAAGLPEEGTATGLSKDDTAAGLSREDTAKIIELLSEVVRGDEDKDGEAAKDGKGKESANGHGERLKDEKKKKEEETGKDDEDDCRDDDTAGDMGLTSMTEESAME